MSDDALNRAYLLLGSNINPEINLPSAVNELKKHGRVVAVSRVLETTPVGFADQPNFLNAAVLLETPLSAHEFHREVITTVEHVLDRIRDAGNKNAPRTIDIDISLFNRDVLKLAHRRIPDPDILTRPFVAVPLAELEPDYVHPQDGRTLAEIAETFSATSSGMRFRGDVALHRMIV